MKKKLSILLLVASSSLFYTQVELNRFEDASNHETYSPEEPSSSSYEENNSATQNKMPGNPSDPVSIDGTIPWLFCLGIILSTLYSVRYQRKTVTEK